MINVISLAHIIQSAILLSGLLVVLFWLWPAVRLDCFRQSIFAIRDELFDYAASGKISFGHPAYHLLRQSMNGFIRYGHQLSFYQFIMTWMTWKAMEGRDSYKWTTKWNVALASLDASTKADLIRFQDRAALHVGKRIVFGSPFLMFSFLISIVAAICHMGWKSLRDLLKTALSETMARSIDQRILEEEAARAAA